MLALGQDRNNLSRTLTILERKGYVKKENSDEDRRYYRISITQEGKQAHEKLLVILEEWRLLFFKDIPVEDLRKFKETAEKLIANLENMKK